PDPAQRLARDLQRPWLRLAAARRPLSDGGQRPAPTRRPPGSALARSTRVSPPDDRCPARVGRGRAPRNPSPRPPARLGDPVALPGLPPIRRAGTARRCRAP